MKPEDIYREILTHLSVAAANSTTRTLLPADGYVNYYVPEMTCYTLSHWIHCGFGLLGAFILIGCVYFYIQVSYESKIFSTSITSKINASFDKYILLTKVVLSFVFSFFGIKKYDWILITFICFFAFLLFYLYFVYYTYSDKTLHMVYSLFVVLFAWTSVVLLLGKLLEFTSFDGCLPLLLLGMPVLLLITACEEKYKKSILKYQLSSFKNGMEVLNQIKILLYLSKNASTVRGSQVLLNGYIQQYESTCFMPNCPLKKYISQLSQGESAYPFLLYHIEVLFRLSVSKFPECMSLRISYCGFLYEYLSHKQKANNVLATMSNHNPTFEEQFIIYHTRQIIEEQKGIGAADDDTDIVSTISYKHSLAQFKQLMTTITFLYMDFWTLLLISCDDQEHLTALSELGTKIINLVEELTRLLAKMQKIHPNDQELLYSYSDFLNNILNEKEKAAAYKSRLVDIKETNDISDTNYFNLDLDALSSSDEYQYIVISGSNEVFGIITAVSLGLCVLLGYSKAELIGRPYDMIMPRIFQKTHKKLLSDKANSFRNEYNDINTYSHYQPKFKGVDSFAKTKARYLVQIPLQVTLIVTESQGISFIAKMNSEQLRNSSDQSSSCYLLTNNNFIIQHFTVNAVSMLGMTSNALNNAMDITGFIKQLYEDFLQEAVEKEDLTPDDKIAIKRYIVNQKYKTTKTINWKLNEAALDQRCKSTSKLKEIYSHTSTDIPHKDSRQDVFALTIHSVVMLGKQEGYVFKLELINNANLHLGLSKLPLQSEMVSATKRNLSAKPLSLYAPNVEMQYDKYKEYIPEGRANLVLDTQHMSFIQNPKNKPFPRDDLKNKAMQKINTAVHSKDTTSIIDEDSYDNTSSDVTHTHEEYASSEYVVSAKDTTEDNINIIKPNANTHATDEYYKVQLTHIKYSIYSYEKQMAIEMPNYRKRSQLDIRLFNDGDGDDKTSNIQEKKSFVNLDLFKDQQNSSDLIQDELIKQQIASSLSVQESQPIITWLKIVMIVILIFFLTLEALMILAITNTQTSLNTTTSLISDTNRLLLDLLICQSAVRDLTLLVNDNYTAFYGTKEEAIAFSLSTIAAIYNDTDVLIDNLITKDARLYGEDYHFFYNETIQLSIIKQHLEVQKYHMTLLSALSQTSNAMFHIINDNVQYIPTDGYIYFILHNMNNDLCYRLGRLANIFMRSCLNVIEDKFVNFYSLLLVSVTIEVVIYFVFSRAYQAVARQKERYLAVFFEIRTDAIKDSLVKCESFAKKIQLQSFTEFLVNDVEHDHYDMTAPRDVKKSPKTNKNTTHTNSKETTYIKVLFLILLVIVAIYKTVEVVLYYFFLERLKVYIYIFQNESETFIEYVLLFRNCKEYCFDSSLEINHTIVTAYFPKYMIHFNLKSIETHRTSLQYKDYMPTKYSLAYDRLFNKELCINDTQLICKDPVISSMNGLSALLPYFVEEIRFMKNIQPLNAKLIEELGFKYNLTLTGLAEYYLLYPADPKLLPLYFRNTPLTLFNNSIYRNLKSMYHQLLLPPLYMLSDLFEACINELIGMTSIISLVVTGLNIIGIIILYVAGWIPFERKLSSILFKTKNLLSIIPKELLTSLSNIQKLLHFNQSFSKGVPSYQKYQKV